MPRPQQPYCGTDNAMHPSFRIFRWRGIAVGAHWSLLLIAGFLAWGLADSTLPSESPGYRPVEYWAVGGATALLLLASITAHEMGHAVIAQRQGLGVNSITLWMFGGVASLDAQPTTWRSELLIGLAGPGVSALLGGVTMAAAAFVSAWGDSNLIVHGLIWFATSNLLLAGFNLLPGAPLDGGRVVAALRWRAHGDAVRARAEAARAGVIVANLMIAAGVVMIFTGMLDSGLWFAFLGWFLASAARQELAAEVLHHSLANVTIGEVMTGAPITVPRGTTISELIHTVLPRARGSTVPVVDQGRLVGLVTPAQFRSLAPEQWNRTLVESVAIPRSGVITLHREDRLDSVLDRVMGNDRRAVVIDAHDIVIGVVSPTDIARAAQHAVLREADARHQHETISTRQPGPDQRR